MSRNNDSGYEMAFRALSTAERNILAKLLSEDFPGRSALMEQLPQARARKIDADGSLALEPDMDAIPAAVTRRIPVEGELEDVDGATIHVLLHVLNGFMNELEVYREDSSPVQGGISPDDLRLMVL
jgi:hypothetical protein